MVSAETLERLAEWKAAIKIDGEDYVRLDLCLAAIEVHVQEATKAEREACARIAEAPCPVTDDDIGKSVNQIIAGRIRHRAISP